MFLKAKLNGKNHQTKRYPKHQVLRPKNKKNEKKHSHDIIKGIIFTIICLPVVNILTI